MFMKKILLCLIIISSCVINGAFADSPPSPLAPGQITVDGDSSDWSDISPFMNEFGVSSSAKDSIDAKSFHMGFTKSDFYFNVVLSPSPTSFSAKEDLSIMQLMFDADTNDSTGNREAKVYKVIPKGFETRFELILTKNNQLVGKLFSKDDEFKKVIKEWKAGSANLAASGDNVEIRIPYNLINFKPGQKDATIRILFAEYANMADKGGYSKQSLKLDFAILENLSAVSSESGAATGGSGFSIWHLIVLTLWVVSILCGFAIAPKAGLSMGLAAINIIPFLGQLAFLFILAFGQWPMHKDYQKLEDRLREYNEDV